MAAFRSAAIRSDCNCTKLYSYPLPSRRACTLRHSHFCPKPLRSQGSAQRRSKSLLPRNLRVQCQAASDIALPGPGGHAEDVVLPEAGLLNPSVLNSQYDSEIVGLAVPALGSILLDPFLSLVDTALVGKLGSGPLAAVGLSSALFNFSNFLFSFLMVVTTPKVASAVARNKLDEASQTTAQGLWLAGVCGVVVGLAIWFGGPFAVTAMKAEGEIARMAVTYLRCRSIAAPVSLAMFVATGSFRGFKDTKTPLIAAVASNLVNLGLDCFLMFVLGWGVAGAALATSASQYASFAVMYYLMLKKGILQQQDMRTVPGLAQVMPILKSGLSLSLRNVSSMVVILTATSMVTGLGTITMAAHEILRQVWIISIQAFMALDICAQSLVASYLGQGKRKQARAVLLRILQIGSAVGVIVGLVAFAGKSAVSTIFTRDLLVSGEVQRVLPMVALFMPMDAIAAIVDGGLLGASDTAYVAKTMLVTSVLSFGALLLAQRLQGGLLGIWLSLKVITTGRVLGGALRLASRKTSPLQKPPKVVAA
ncbi:TPA: hypothetical protein ACH3X3_005589 [Trebouxia sp. C0006]